MEEGFLQLSECINEVERNRKYKQGSNNENSQATCTAITNRYELSIAIQRSNVFESAKKRFEKSRVKATRAFNNRDLSLEYRIFAVYVKVIAQIFECPENPTTAINLCLSYITKLHELDGVREMFSVSISGGLRAMLDKSQRMENMKSVILLNHHLYQFIARINNNHDHLSTWPSIEIGKEKIFNPMCDWYKVFTPESWGEVLIHSSKEMEKMKATMFQILEEMTKNEHVKTLPSSVEGTKNSGKEDILIAGGYSQATLKSVEIFSWKEEKWFNIASMKNEHWLASSFIYNDNLFVVGGSGSKSTETLNLKQLPLTWKTFPGELPYDCYAHQTVVYKQQILYIGGFNEDKRTASDLISKLQITGATSCVLKELCYLPEPREYHGAEVVDDKIFIFGGMGRDNNILSSVLEFSSPLKCNKRPPLPYSLFGMATVRWKDQVVLLGGYNGREVLNSVVMYDSKTGQTTLLPSMLENRTRCCAVITDDTIVVMGGLNDKVEGLKSVECFKIGSSSSWTYLPSMSQPRFGAITEILPFGQKYI
ncbi:kelch-like protein 38 [Xenia sp. Carnegie-2017]|uniref:kelch-like protein 38 n=1 Tax=Xenia sp. Carnegie-2017 TaxID=2897299 RepID=UPI001F045CFC|nr:kelch-like protein 38 [Xenia sp. Carnegie-2017]